MPSDVNSGRRGVSDMSERYTVWVGGSEVNAYYLTQESAEEIAEAWKSRGYDDVQIERVSV